MTEGYATLWDAAEACVSEWLALRVLAEKRDPVIRGLIPDGDGTYVVLLGEKRLYGHSYEPEAGEIRLRVRFGVDRRWYPVEYAEPGARSWTTC